MTLTCPCCNLGELKVQPEPLTIVTADCTCRYKVDEYRWFWDHIEQRLQEAELAAESEAAYDRWVDEATEIGWGRD